MTDTAERAIGEAESWLVSAKDKLGMAENDEAAAIVCCSLAIHAIIRANDAISLKFLRVKATRHDDAPAIFSKLLQQGKLGSENRRFIRLLQKAMSDKSGADYGKKAFHYSEAKKYVEDAEEFVAAVKSLVK
ncbi:MAG: hypothetical protein UX17_C0037G0002 [Parcubacteria group bacterium GW2011_GWC2_45_7]|nr:MAG: hypothetical protein UX17_C0037G0002 [Parcubacteria group bacterium GW2011_GWC2_45_7]HIH18359.1 hypothetical protein [Candidatus Micrarchaeota archaeon]HIH31044.1 hypothetical protein [Candidatus Micrarchaeota archaeon]